MKISILLPYKENFSPEYAGAVSIYVNDTTKCSKYKKTITIFGNTDYTKKLSNNYINLQLKKEIFQSGSKIYIDNFLSFEKNNNSELIEIHNRPGYIKSIYKKTNAKLVLYFHNDPLGMNGSKSINERLFLINNLEKIIFNSEWSKKRFINKLDNFYHKLDKLEVIPQSTNKVKINLNNKKRIICFIGKLNTAKGYDIFGKAVVKILNKYPEWKSIVIGDEPRERLHFKHKNLSEIGFQKHNIVLNTFKKSSIAIACSRWEEPFGRTSLEASSRGCAVIISNRGGLPETVTNAIILRKLNVQALYQSIEKLIINRNYRINLQKNSIKNFYLTNSFVTKKIDIYRNKIINSKKFSISTIKKNKYKILHITNLNERHNGRLFYNTGTRINNGFIRLKHSVLTLSDRDIVSYYRSIGDIDGSKTLNKKLIEIISNYLPDIIVIGHADLIKSETLKFIKKNYPNIKIAQWFLDRMDSEWKNNKIRFLDKINYIDVSFCTTSPDILKFSKKNKIFYIPNPADESFENLEIYNQKNFTHDVFFAMSHGVHRGILKKNKFDKRELFINKLIKNIPNIRFDIYGMNNVQPVWADNFKKVITKSKMAINLSQGKPTKYYTSDRITHLIGNGMLTFIDIKTKLNNFFKNDEVVFYNSINDLSNKITKYSKNEKLRISIAKKGKKKYLTHFNSTLIAQYILDRTLNINNKKKYFWEKN